MKCRDALWAVCRWIAAGRPRRGGREVIRIYETICKPCEHFKPRGDDDGACKLCGCALKKLGWLTGKIGMATESCPIGKWVASHQPPPEQSDGGQHDPRPAPEQ